MNKNYDEIKTAAVRFFDRLGDLEQAIFSWANRKLKLDKTFIKTQGEFMDKMSDFPEQWQDFMVPGYYFSKVIFDPVVFNKIYKAVKDELSPSEELMLKTWKKYQPRWSVFTAERTDNPEFFTITDTFSGEQSLLYSKGVGENLKNPGMKNKPFLCALVHNGHCWSTYGMIRQYAGLTENDFSFLVEFLDENLFKAKGLNGIINKFYARFFTIDRYMEVPLVYSGDNMLESCWTEIILEGFVPENYDDVMEVFEVSDEYVHLIQKKESPGFPGYELFFDRKTGDALLTANIRDDYNSLIEALSREYTIDSEPDAIVSMNLFITIRNSMEFNLPFDKWTAMFPAAAEDDDSENAELLAKVNMLLQEKVEAENMGVKYNLEERAALLGFTPENIEEFETMFERLKTDFVNQDITGGIEYQVPPPAIRKLFTHSLKQSRLFSIDSGPESFKLFNECSDEVFTDDLYFELPEIIDDCFTEDFEEYGRTIMNTFFYILCQKKRESHQVKDYAAEILRLFGHVILPGLSCLINDFIEDLSILVYEDLVSSGLIEVEIKPAKRTLEKGRFDIKPSRFFEKYIKLNELK